MRQLPFKKNTRLSKEMTPMAASKSLPTLNKPSLKDDIINMNHDLDLISRKISDLNNQSGISLGPIISKNLDDKAEYSGDQKLRVMEMFLSRIVELDREVRVYFFIFIKKNI